MCWRNLNHFPRKALLRGLHTGMECQEGTFSLANDWKQPECHGQRADL